MPQMKKKLPSVFLDREEQKKLVVESVLIVFSVLLALFLNRSAENLKTNNQKKAALERIHKEIHTNNEIIKEWQTRHQLYLKRVDKITGDKNDSLRTLLLKKKYLDIDVITAGKGITNKLISSTAWDAARSTQIMAEFDYTTIETLTGLYQSQAITLDVLNRISEVYFNNSVITSEDTFQATMLKYRLLFNELLIQENNLVQFHYKEALHVLQPYAADH